MRDYGAVNAGVSGHGGTYLDPDGGAFGSAGQSFFHWALRGETEASTYSLDGGAEGDEWTTENKDLDSL